MERHALSAIDSRETGPLGVPHLRRLWARAQLGMLGAGVSPDEDERLLDMIAYDTLAMGTTDAVKFLFQPGLPYEAFEEWVASLVPPERIDLARHRLSVAISDAAPPELALPPNEDEAVLSEEDLAFFEQHGYVIVHDAVPEADRVAAEQVIWEALDATPDDPDSWYTSGWELRRKVMVELYRHPALEATRSASRIRRAYAQLWQTDALCYTTDRAGFSLPERHDYQFSGPYLHWDVHFMIPMPFSLQGILYLTDTPAEQGAFQCVPGFHHRMDKWLASLPPDADPNIQAQNSLEPQPIAGRAGDLIIWHHCLPHGPTPNRGSKPRIVQYVTMYPYHRHLGRRK